MAQVPLSWKLQIQGAEDVKSKLNEVNSAFQRGEISVQEWSKGQKEALSASRALTNQSRLESQVFLALHPRLNTLSRSLSTVASVARTAQSIFNSWNIAMLATQGASSQIITDQAEVAAAQREVNRLVSQGKTGTEEYQKAMERLAIANAKLKESMDADFQQRLSNVFNAITNIALIASVSGKQLSKLGPALKEISTAISVLGVGGVLGLGALAGAFAAVALAGWMVGEQIAYGISWIIDQWGYLEYFYWSNVEPIFTDMIRFFTVSLPAAITGAFTTAWNMAIQITQAAINGIITGVEAVANAVVTAINVLIRAYNRAASKLRLPTIGTLSTVSLPRLQLEQVGKSNEVSNPVSIPSNAGTIQYVMNQNVQGSILKEKELKDLFDSWLKGELKRYGFTGYT